MAAKPPATQSKSEQASYWSIAEQTGVAEKQQLVNHQIVKSKNEAAKQEHVQDLELLHDVA